MKCLSICKNGKKCKKSKLRFHDHCYFHVNVNCSICFENESDNFTFLKCGHSFCKNCIYKWLVSNSTCPCCRTTVTNYEMETAHRYCIQVGILIKNVNINYYNFNEDFIDYTNGMVVYGQPCTEDTWDNFLSYIKLDNYIYNIFVTSFTLPTVSYVLKDSLNQDYVITDATGRSYVYTYTLN